MKTIEVNIYKFNELSNEAKETAIKKQQENPYYLDYDWWDGVYDHFHEKAKTEGFDVSKMYFSGFYSQGDGAMFEYKLEDDILFKQFIEHLKLSPMRKNWLLNNSYVSATGKHSGMYYHSKFCSHSIYWQVDNGDLHWSTNFYKWIESFSDDFDEFVIDIYEDLCNELYDSLEKEYEWLMSDEVIAEHLEVNDYDFTEDGERY